jgi:hypothetical protein
MGFQLIVIEAIQVDLVDGRRAEYSLDLVGKDLQDGCGVRLDRASSQILPNENRLLIVKPWVLWVEVMGSFDGLEHEKDLVASGEDIEGHEMSFDPFGGELLKGTKEVEGVLQRIGRPG